jgi:Big-like domain-containing protein
MLIPSLTSDIFDSSRVAEGALRLIYVIFNSRFYRDGVTMKHVDGGTRNSAKRPDFPWVVNLAGASALFMLLAIAAACGGFFVDPTLTAIAITPATPSVVQTKTQQLTATGSYDDGSVSNISSKVSWSSSDSSTVSVTGTGLVTGISPGSATITASSANISGSTTVGVTTANLASIQVSPSTVSALTGQTVPFRAVATFVGGGTGDITDAVIWSSDNSKVSISNSPPTNGEAQISGPFSSFPVRVTITATSGSVSGRAALAVTQ